MTHATTTTDPAARPGDRLPLARREWALIVAFWGTYALLSITSRVLDQRDGGGDPLLASAAVTALEALCWMALTPLVFHLAAGAAREEAPDGVAHVRTPQVVVLLATAIVIALAMGWVSTELRALFTPHGPRGPRQLTQLQPLAPGPGPRGDSHGPGGPPIWFGILNAFIVFAGTLAAGLARAYFRRYLARREQTARLQAQLAEARLDALRRQLDPHFLFNTLNAVSALVERDPRGVRRMIARLSELLRHSFEGADEPEVPLRQELALLNRYVEIMQVRFQGRLTVDTRVDDDDLDALVPGLILQPLVENAIKHGVERLAGPGTVVIEAEREGDALVLRVCDDGPGPPAPESVATEGTRRGVGLRNTTARLAELYGTRHRFALGPGPLGGAVAEIRLPYHVRTGTPSMGTPVVSRAVAREEMLHVR